ncbi:SAM-dependent methyltransferase [Phytohabitans rumicis]|uniref:S-adenosyl methyltransferase n=1 Tax=Phytohabitans rumicis TaxID=1076125 RepID=A0A6V8L3P4_9ACTN|nr:SAM-dependent methyltransferase [Phytohabitans rumicis]GFJ88697.1 hypothetical protein Prum_023390 [Phytohabitans rumicis]
MTGGPGTNQKPATAARIYDYYLGGIHNFTADQEAAKAILAKAPSIVAIARANRAFLGRAIRYLADSGVRQYLDIGSGIPTEGNVHEVAQQVVPDARVVYVDIDPVAVAESQELLEGNPYATAVRGDLREPEKIIEHPQVRKVLDFTQPVAVLLVGVLYFVPDDAEAYPAMERLLAPCVPGSHVVISHGTVDGEPVDERQLQSTTDIWRRQTATPLSVRSRAQIERFFGGFELIEPGLAWLPEWRPEPTDPADFRDEPWRSRMLAGVGRLP